EAHLTKIQFRHLKKYSYDNYKDTHSKKNINVLNTYIGTILFIFTLVSSIALATKFIVFIVIFVFLVVNAIM
ncbi:hypothetical protein LHK22_14290, partial [Staphylococcus argenteus]|nr:hypothetical protein [Staphylococcus argenteus]